MWEGLGFYPKQCFSKKPIGKLVGKVTEECVRLYCPHCDTNCESARGQRGKHTKERFLIHEVNSLDLP